MSKDFDEIDYYSCSGGSNVLIVDGLNLAFRYKHANKKNFAVDFLTTVKSFASSYNCSDVYVLGDGGSKYRKSIYPKYKANREDLRAKQTPEEAKEFEEFIEDFNKALELCSSVFTTMLFSGVEADDIAAYLVQKLESKVEHIWLISSDKDWDLLVSEKVSRFSYRTRKEVTFENWHDHYLYDLEDHISIKVLTGDKGDNIPGVEGVGEKRAYAILRQYGPTALDVYDNLPIKDKRKFMQNLNDFKDMIFTNYALMDLRTYAEEALGEHKEKVDKILAEKYGRSNEQL